MDGQQCAGIILSGLSRSHSQSEFYGGSKNSDLSPCCPLEFLLSGDDIMQRLVILHHLLT